MKQNKPILDIAVLTAGRSDLFAQCIQSILPQMRPGYEIHVCNNGFPSKEYEDVYKLLPDGSRIKRLNQNNGFAYGANTAIKSGSAPLILFITDDVFLHEGAIEALLKRMEDKTIGQCGYKLLFPEDSTDPNRPAGRVQHIGMAANIRGDMAHPLIGWSPDNPKCCVSREVLAVTGASFMIRRSVFNQVGGFDVVYGMGYYEDTDLSMKVRASGHKVFIDTDAKATHGVGQTFKSVDGSQIPFQQNQMIFRSRWLKALSWSDFELW